MDDLPIHDWWVPKVLAFISEYFGQHDSHELSFDSLAVVSSVLQRNKADFDLIVGAADKEMLIMQLVLYLLDEIARNAGENPRHVSQEAIEARLRYLREDAIRCSMMRKSPEQ